MPTEQNLRARPINYRQSAIFADIQPWDLRAAWMDKCGCGQAPGWIPDYSTDSAWETPTSVDPGWTVTDVDPNNHIGCP